MSAIADLAALASGRDAAKESLTATCRLEWRGGEAYGEEALLEAFRRAPLDLAAGTAIETPGALLWSDGHSALVVDLYDGRLGRLWRVGPGEAPAREPSISVPFDTDLSQHRRDLLWRPEDHPWLAADRRDAAEALAQRLAEPTAADHRVRLFVIRACSTPTSVGLLGSIFRMSAAATRTLSFSLVAALATPEGEQIAVDEIAPAEWVPRL